ncbi:protein-L-isoaspartate(D-aspartate) O-methyltransferase [Ectothiorhodospira mobilis]|uniref:protein-L-isoaspartate(D-aspartate) O-methyltransferase n=1 Tax=Ectothiorhodospira mobilis TaxID=195064 RepID=UPI001907F762|nr:protein-L-isoaspartate(D-aspartate) O-methyltransferase [Ectothiorhodospira mobilis]MBK1690902.1 protein-L-isoaspartate O-methyltransferase [Ectothiorhodospira mobilis]
MKDPIDRLIRRIRDDYQATATTTGLEAPSPAVEAALRHVPRERFVPGDLVSRAWDNTALPIGHGQTISQPFIVALMTDLLALDKDSRVLEVGTGCGYQTAVLAEMAAQVHTIEVVPELAQAARERLRELGYTRVETRVGDGRAGWPGAAPFDAILVTAAAPGIPPALPEQLRPGGRLVLPVDSGWQAQDLMVVTRAQDGGLQRHKVLGVRFVPLVPGQNPPATGETD